MATTREQYRARMRSLYARLAEAQHMADKADKEWNRLNIALNARIEATRRQRLKEGRRLKKMEVNNYKSEDIDLSDAFAVQSWWRTQAMYISSLILAEKAMWDEFGGS